MSEAVATIDENISAQTLYEYYSRRVKDAESRKQSLEKDLNHAKKDLTEARSERDKYKRQCARERKANQ